MGFDWKRIEQADTTINLTYKELKKLETLLSVQIHTVRGMMDKKDVDDKKLIKEYDELHSKICKSMFEIDNKYYTKEEKTV